MWYFQVKQHEFREQFRKTAPFTYDSKRVYPMLDQVIRIYDVIMYIPNVFGRTFDVSLQMQGITCIYMYTYCTHIAPVLV